jgi:hypothetical protein
MKSNQPLFHRLLRQAALALTGCLLLGGAALADPPGRVGRLADFTGTVWFFDAEQGEWTQAQRNRPLTSGDRLTTDPGVRAELQIGSTTLRLDGGSELDLQRLDDERLRVQLDSGSLALRVRSQEVLDEIEIITPEGRFLPLRPGHYRIDRSDDATLASAWSGDLRFEASDSTLVIAAGQRAEFWQEGPQRTTHYNWTALDHDGFTQWAAAEDRRDDRRAASRYVSPEMTGAEDLDRYGRWDTHPEYGTLWTPYRVSPGWAPYRAGHWAWVRPWGWTWVDDAPWGFAPFHYGRWVSWRGNWCWAPGSYIARPVYAPALVAWIGGGHVSVGVSIGSPGYVGWVPLGPREAWVPHYHASPGYVRNVNITHVHVRDHRRPPPQPIMYTNRGVPGAVTVVPADVLRARQPVAQAVARVEPNVMRRVIEQRIDNQAPPAPVVRTVVAPNAVVPPAPGRVELSRGADGRMVRPAVPREPAMRAAVPPPQARPQAPQAVAPAQAPAHAQHPTPSPRIGGAYSDDGSRRPPVMRSPRIDGAYSDEGSRRPPVMREAPVARPLPPQVAAPARVAPPPAAVPQVAPQPPPAVVAPPPQQAVHPQPRRGRDDGDNVEGRGQRGGRDRGDEPPGHQRRGGQQLN